MRGQYGVEQGPGISPYNHTKGEHSVEQGLDISQLDTDYIFRACADGACLFHQYTRIVVETRQEDLY